MAVAILISVVAIMIFSGDVHFSALKMYGSIAGGEERVVSAHADI
jgi:hypothetical protein